MTLVTHVLNSKPHGIFRANLFIIGDDFSEVSDSETDQAHKPDFGMLTSTLALYILVNYTSHH